MKCHDEQELSEIKQTKQAAPNKSSEEKVECKHTTIFKSEDETIDLRLPQIPQQKTNQLTNRPTDELKISKPRS